MEKEQSTGFCPKKSSTSGFRGQCKECDKESNKVYYAANKEKVKQKVREYVLGNKEKIAESNSKWYAVNKVSVHKKVRAWKLANPEKVRANRIKNYDPEKNKARYEANKDKYAEQFKKYYGGNKSEYIARAAKRRANKIKATPAWANHGYIRLFYEGAKIEEKRTGRKVHVDHIVPLQGKLVCGLHCEGNLQLLFAEDNLSKSNKFEAGA